MIIIKCIECRKKKPEDEFTLWRGRRNKTCDYCRRYNNQWYAEDKNGRKKAYHNYYMENKARIAIYRAKLRLDRKYKMTPAEYDSMLQKQNNCCKICEQEFVKYKPCVDHNHETGKVRALLCRRCNLWLHAVENKDFVARATSYLEQMK